MPAATDPHEIQEHFTAIQTAIGCYPGEMDPIALATALALMMGNVVATAAPDPTLRRGWERGILDQILIAMRAQYQNPTRPPPTEPQPH